VEPSPAFGRPGGPRARPYECGEIALHFHSSLPKGRHQNWRQAVYRREGGARPPLHQVERPRSILTAACRRPAVLPLADLQRAPHPV